jgi:hypothetical protein
VDNKDKTADLLLVGQVSLGTCQQYDWKEDLSLGKLTVSCGLNEQIHNKIIKLSGFDLGMLCALSPECRLASSTPQFPGVLDWFRKPKMRVSSLPFRQRRAFFLEGCQSPTNQYRQPQLN